MDEQLNLNEIEELLNEELVEEEDEGEGDDLRDSDDELVLGQKDRSDDESDEDTVSDLIDDNDKDVDRDEIHQHESDIDDEIQDSLEMVDILIY